MARTSWSCGGRRVRLGGRCKEEWSFLHVDSPDGVFPPVWWKSNSLLPGLDQCVKGRIQFNLTESMGPQTFGYENHGCVCERERRGRTAAD